MQMNGRKLAFGAGVAVAVIVGAAWGFERFWSARSVAPQPEIASVPPLAPVARSSVIVTPIRVTMTAIKDTLEAAVPHDFSDRLDVSQMPFLSDADVNWSVSRGAFTVANQADGIALSTPLNGVIRATGQELSSGGLLGRSGQLSNLLGQILGGDRRGSDDPPKNSGSSRESSGSIQGDATLTARPILLPQWRIEPNITSQVRISDASFSVMGTRVRVPEIAKGLLDRAIDQQITELQSRLRDDPSLERAVQQEWAKMCRSVPLRTAAPEMPDLWLEVRPTRAFAAQPAFKEDAVLLTVGVQADTRVTPNETRPDCPFPAKLEVVPQMEQGRFAIALPIDIPFTELTRLIEGTLRGKTFPEDNSGAFSATIKSVNFAASGDRLLISVGVRANETKSWFGLGADATVHVWGRPVLDRERQMLRLNDVALDVQSYAAFGLLGAAARTAIPSLEKALADNAVIDLVPLAAEARRNIERSVADFRRSSDSVAVDAQVTELRLDDVQFDAKSVRVIADADGTVRASVTRLQPVGGP